MHPRELLTQLVYARSTIQRDIFEATGEIVHVALTITDQKHETRSLIEAARQMGWTVGSTGTLPDAYRWAGQRYDNNPLDYIEVRQYRLAEHDLPKGKNSDGVASTTSERGTGGEDRPKDASGQLHDGWRDGGGAG